MRRLILALAALAVVSAAVAGSALAFGGGGGHGFTLRWEIKITNLTPATGPGASQPLSPPLVVIHNRRADVWERGATASPGVAAIAQDADNSVAEGALTGAPGVRSVGTFLQDNGSGVPPVIFPGDTLTFTVDSDLWANRISIVSMLVNSNDAFTGLDSKPLLPFGLFGRTWYVNAYDAGSEVNNELKSHIPGPCCNSPFVDDPEEGGVITHHPGIQGGHDLDPSVYGWSGPVAKIQIRPAFHR